MDFVQPLTDAHIEGEIRRSDFGSMKALAHYLFVEHPEYKQYSTEKLSAIIGIDARVLETLSVHPGWRKIQSEIRLLQKLDPEKLDKMFDRQITTAISAEQDRDAIAAFRELNKQAGFLRDEKHIHQSIEISVKPLPDADGGFTPSVDFEVPTSRRKQLGQKVGVLDQPGIRGLTAPDPKVIDAIPIGLKTDTSIQDPEGEEEEI